MPLVKTNSTKLVNGWSTIRILAIQGSNEDSQGAQEPLAGHSDPGPRPDPFLGCDLLHTGFGRSVDRGGSRLVAHAFDGRFFGRAPGRRARLAFCREMDRLLRRASG